MTLLAVDKLNKKFGGVVAARDVSFSLAAGEILAMIGPNGAGKSTSFNMVGGQLRPDSGRVFLGVGRSFQVAQTFLSMSVLENLQMALIAHAGRTRDMVARADTLFCDEALGLLAELGMVDAAARPMNTLAYGDVKRVELAIALAGKPRLLLMDEPTAGMAPGERAALMRLVAGIARRTAIGVLFTEHDMDAVFAHADRILVLVRGEIIAAGTPEEVRANPEVQRVYLGTSGLRAALRARANAHG
jgi:branched-chain amino acid transport system ATP-binding protein